MPHAVFLDFASTSQGDLDVERLKLACDQLQLHAYTTLEQRLAHIGQAEIIISNKVVLERSVLEQLRHQVKLICVAATGTNNVDLQAAKQWGIPVTNIRNYASRSVAEHTVGLMFALARQIPQYQKAVEQGKWAQSKQFCVLDYPITELGGKTLGIIGYGALGQATAQLAQAIGLNVWIADRLDASQTRSERVAFNQVIEQADIISLHCPLTPETQHLMNAQRLKQMKPSAWLINTARGALVEPHHLIQALREGWIAGAALDVITTEPPSADEALIQAQLSNLIITPHIAWASQTARQCLIDQLAAIISAWRRGELINQVA